jgi:peptidoglycan L-alanyl-D-glutamate endopeptidase CwlK
MAFRYGGRSLEKLATCHPTLERIAHEALRISPYDITIIHGLRGEAVQNALYDSHASTKRYPDSRHNKTDDYQLEKFKFSDALDFAPYVNGKIYWKDTHIFAVVAGCFIAAANNLEYKLRWGGDWDSDGTTTDQTLMDWGHLEMKWGPIHAS